MKRSLLLVEAFFVLCVYGAKYNFIIGIDGLGGELYFPNANTPVMNSLIANGTSSILMQDVITTSSSQNWMSMIAGACNLFFFFSLLLFYSFPFLSFPFLLLFYSFTLLLFYSFTLCPHFILLFYYFF